MKNRLDLTIDCNFILSLMSFGHFLSLYSHVPIRRKCLLWCTVWRRIRKDGVEAYNNQHFIDSHYFFMRLNVFLRFWTDLTLGGTLLFPIDDKESRNKGQDLVTIRHPLMFSLLKCFWNNMKWMSRLSQNNSDPNTAQDWVETSFKKDTERERFFFPSL